MEVAILGMASGLTGRRAKISDAFMIFGRKGTWADNSGSAVAYFGRKGTGADDSEALWLITISVIWNWKNMIKC
jgi:hypothetical protein